jgi:hypothetical protein
MKIVLKKSKIRQNASYGKTKESSFFVAYSEKMSNLETRRSNSCKRFVGKIHFRNLGTILFFI